MVESLSSIEKSTNVRFFVITSILPAFLALLAPGRVQAAAQAPDLTMRAADAAIREGAALIEQGRWEEARQAFERAIDWNADLGIAYYNLGVILGVLGRGNDAITAYRRALQRQPTLDDARVNIGVELFQQNRLAEALDTLREAVRKAPAHVAAHHNLGVVLSALGRLDEALTVLDRAAALAPEDDSIQRALADTHYNVGVEHARQRRWAAALASHETALRFNRELPEAWNGIGLALARTGRHELAVTMYGEALSRRPAFAAAHYNLARSLVALRRYSDAIAACQTVIESQPNLQPAVHLLDHLRRLVAPASRRSGA
jgi:tetratricopeptide (TPR) repeat protein